MSQPQMSAAAALSQQLAGDTLLDIASKVEQVLSLQSQIERHVASLQTGQGATQSAIADLRQSLGIGKHQDTNGVSASGSSLGSKDSTGRPISKYGSQSVSIKPVRMQGSSDPISSLLAKSTGRASLESNSSSVPAKSLCSLEPAPGRMRSLVAHSRISAGSVVEQDVVDKMVEELLDGGDAACVMTPGGARHARRYTLDPQCRLRMGHDILSIVVLATDIIVALVVLAWNLEVNDDIAALNIMSFSFWCADIVLNFFTGFYSEGMLESRPYQVAKRYLRSWFVPDLAIVAADLATFLLGDSGASSRGNGPSMQLSKAARYLRLIRVARLGRVADILARLVEVNTYIEVVVDFMKPFVVIMVINHILACMCWSVSNYMPTDTGLRWVHEPVSVGAEVSFREVGFWLQYWTCMHWSLAQLTVGSMDVTPCNTYERAFNFIGLVVGMVVFSCVLSSISAKIMKRYLHHKDKRIKFGALRRFLRARVQPSTAVLAQFQASKALFGSSGKPVTMEDVDFTMIPLTLQRNIRAEICQKHLQHPLLRWWFLVDLKGAQSLCHTAIEFVGLVAEDNLFLQRAHAVGAYVMTSGAATYRLEANTLLGSSEQVVRRGRFFCEAALWCAWKHVGELTASTGCEVLLLRTSEFIECVDHVVAVKHVMVSYGRLFLEAVKGSFLLDDEEHSLPNDLDLPNADFASLLLLLPSECKQLIGAAAVNAKWQIQGWRDLTDDSAGEVRDGTACFMVNWAGEFERIVSISVLQLQRHDGKLLVFLGSHSEDGIVTCCELPGHTQRGDETPDQAFARLLEGALGPFAQHIEVTGIEREETCKESKRMRLKTKYLTIVHHARITCPADELGLDAIEISTARKSTRSTGSNTRRKSTISLPRSLTSAWAAAEMTSSSSTLGNDQFGDIRIYALAAEEGGIHLVSWLTPEELNRFTGPGGDAALQHLLEACVVPPELVSGGVSLRRQSSISKNEEEEPFSAVAFSRRCTRNEEPVPGRASPRRSSRHEEQEFMN